MKKFLIFLVSIIVVVSLGLTTYYFMRNDEVITIETKEIYCNAGDIISLESLNINVKKPHKKTTYNYNAGGSKVTSMVSFDEKNNYYVVSNDAGGTIKLVISTTNKRFPEFKITLHVGNGEAESPYYVFNEADLNKIGVTYSLNAHYLLMNDITLTKTFKPIGYRTVGETVEWQGFGGCFNGNSRTISNLELVNGDYSNAGLFYQLNTNSVVENLNLNNVKIEGAYQNAGALAGVISGNVNKVAINKVSIVNNQNSASIGGFAGEYLNGNIKMSYVNAANINVTGTDVKVGGFAGKLEEVVATATYANGSILSNEATGLFGGYAGEFVINTNSGSIMQSYTDVTCEQENYAAFIGRVTAKEGFNAKKSNMLTHFIGNVAITNIVGSVSDNDVVKEFDSTYFANKGESVFYNENSALYMIRSYNSLTDAIDGEFVFYAVDTSSTGKTMWDTTYVWKLSPVAMPTLVMGSIEPDGVSGEYFRKDLELQEINSTTRFKNKFSQDLDSQVFKLVEDVDLTSGWTPVSLSNCTIDGNGKTIKVNFNNAVNGNLGLFAKLDNCTIKNLNIEVVGISANATNFGAIATEITSSSNLSDSSLQNINVKYLVSEVTINATNFGGLVSIVDRTSINNIKVSGLNISAESNIENIGGLATVLSANANNIEIDAVLSGTKTIGGAVAMLNGGSLTETKAQVAINYSKSSDNALIGGLVASNGATIQNSNLVLSLSATSNTNVAYIGGVASINNGTIIKTYISGSGISLGAGKTYLSGSVFVGGIASINNGNILETYNTMESIGALASSADYRVGGVAFANNGTISKVLTSSNLYGNYVAGVAVEMKGDNNTYAIDQVIVGVYNKETGVVEENIIAGYKYVAGLIVDFRKGIVSNVQLVSSLQGKETKSTTSLLVLVFTKDALVENSTVNSSMYGYGKFYRDSWVDYETEGHHSTFGYIPVPRDATFNAYTGEASGKMKSVVINEKYNDNVAVKYSVATESNAFNLIPMPWNSDYYNGVSFIKEVADFENRSNFEGKFTFEYAHNYEYPKLSETKEETLTFNIGGVWTAGNGIYLSFLDNI